MAKLDYKWYFDYGKKRGLSDKDADRCAKIITGYIK